MPMTYWHKEITMFSHQMLQREYLAQLIKHQKPVTLHFKNGHRKNGVIMGITDEVIFFNHGITDYFYQDSIYAVNPIAHYTTNA
jgi:sRNA-binding regulator protein Hfq